MFKTPFQPTEDPNTATVESWRTSTLRMLGPTHELSIMPWSELKEFPIFPGSTLGSRLIEVPERWLPNNRFQMPGVRKLDPSIPGSTNPQSDPLGARLDEAVRRGLLALWLPRRTAQGQTRVYVPASWITMCGWLLRVAAWSLQNAPNGCTTLFEHLSSADLQAMRRSFATGGELRSDHLNQLIHCLLDAGARGVLSDAPRIREEALTKAVAQSEDDRKDATVPEPQRVRKSKVWQPFEDSFVSGVIGKALWLQRNLAEQIIDCWDECRGIRDAAVNAGHAPSNPKWVLAPQRVAIASTLWIAADQSEVTQARVIEELGVEAGAIWPPRKMSDLNRWIEIIKGLNFHVIAFCTGARGSEINSATDASLIFRSGEAFLRATTTKTSGIAEGEMRDWPLHPAGVKAFQVQARLAQCARSEGSNHLWVVAHLRSGADGKQFSLWSVCVTSAKSLGLASLSGSSLSLDERLRSDKRRGLIPGEAAESNDNAHPHRWRHTVARLVALTVVEAPRVLFDLFGHRSIDMTLRYMTSHPRIREDAERIAEEAALILAEEAIEETLEERSSGPAAGKVRAALAELEVGAAYEREDDAGVEPTSAMKLGELHFEVPTLREAARKLTVAKRAWRLASPGVLCTKAEDESGPCTSGGAPDPGACRTTCEHRLERKAAEGQCRGVLRELLGMHRQAEAEGRKMFVANIEGQIRANLARWETVRKEVLAESDVARRLWADATS